jgi:flagellar hook assembly protein FlgD
MSKMITIKYQIPEKEYVKIKVYALNGRQVASIVDDVQLPGYYKLNWKCNNVRNSLIPGGNYIVSFNTKKYRKSYGIRIVH